MKLQAHNKINPIVLVIMISIAALQSSFVPRSFEASMIQPAKNLGGWNYAVLISQPNHVKPVLNTAGSITADSKYKRDTFVVMACGKSAEAFVKGSNFAEMIRKGRSAGIDFKVCGMSLQQFNIDPETLMEGIEVVPNGLTYMFDLQIKGYRTVEL